MSVRLVLFDIDGTLLLDDAYAHGRAMVEAAREVYGVALADDAVMAIGPQGRTDPEILGAMLAAAGVAPAGVAARLPQWIAVAGERFAHEAPSAVSGWRVRAGLLAVVSELAAAGCALGVVTGNLERIARVKLDLIGLVRLGAGPSAFGSEAGDRAALVRLACARAGLPATEAVVVGDTPRDVAAARAAGARCVCFASEAFGADALARADAVIVSAADLPAALAGLADGTA